MVGAGEDEIQPGLMLDDPPQVPFRPLTPETAQVLGITEEAGAKRYIRALKRLKAVLAAMPGGLEGI